VVKAKFLIAAHVAEGTIIEDQSDEVDLFLHGRCEFLQAEEEAAVTTGAHNGLIRIRDFDA
jgi:hypothetical protein